MGLLLARIRAAAVAIGILAIAGFAVPAFAQQPNAVNPSASVPREDQLFQQLKKLEGRCSIPDAKACTLEQPAGRDWRGYHQTTLPWIGAIAIVGILLVLVLFYLMRGMVKLEAGRSGRTVVRFNAFERFVHWMTAVCFLILAFSGLNITFGKSVLLPLLGPNAFTAFSQWAKYAHNYLSFPFTIGVALICLMWIAGNIPNAVDVAWIKRGGGIVGGDHPPAYRFNAGQKFIYWIVVLGGGAAAVTGYLLMFPFYTTDVTGMQLAQVVHGTVGVLFFAAMLAHIYIGTIGMEGAFEAMGTGEVDVNWARQHHRLWLDQEQARTGPNEAQQQPHATPAE